MDKTIVLRDGRTLGYAEYGDPKGFPVFFFHGWPSSRYHGSAIQEAAKKLKARVISIDRPGIGLSSFQPKRKLLDWPDDVIELADQLGVKNFSVLGVSGGGPYTAVCAYKIPKRLVKAGIVVGLAPTYVPGILDGMRFFQKLSWQSYSIHPIFCYLASGLNYIVANYFPALLHIGFGTKTDQKIVKDMKDKYVREAREPFKTGLIGAAQELNIYTHDWGFCLEEIKKEAYLWYGEKDQNVPIRMAKYYSESIPKNKIHVYPNEGHLILRVHSEEILKKLIL